jgi:regulator of sirC expression with transglutaminase-like and TPR domain
MTAVLPLPSLVETRPVKLFSEEQLRRLDIDALRRLLPQAPRSWRDAAQRRAQLQCHQSTISRLRD